MWTRAELKDRAKQDMKPFYWYGVLVCFIAGILGAGSSGGGGSISAGSRSSRNSYSGSGVWDEHSMTIFLIVLGVILVVMAIAIVIGIFVSNLVGSVSCATLWTAPLCSSRPESDVFSSRLAVATI